MLYFNNYLVINDYKFKMICASKFYPKAWVFRWLFRFYRIIYMYFVIVCY